MSDLTIRAATVADASALARMRYLFRNELRAATEAEAPFLARCTSWIRETLGRDGGGWLCWVAEEHGTLIGNLWLQRIEKLPNPVDDEREQHAYVSNVYVIPERRDARVGALLFEAALAWCRQAEVDAVLLWPSPRSRSFYARYGFAPSDDLFVLQPASR